MQTVDPPNIDPYPFPSRFLTGYETAYLIDLVGSVRPQVMIEFGCNEGKTARAVLSSLPSLHCYLGIDAPTDHMPRLMAQVNEVPRWPGHVGQYAAEDQRFTVMIRKGGSANLTANDLMPCDATFIDGDHSLVVALHDTELSRKLVRPGGIIVWHDYGNPTVEVTDMLDKLCADGWPISHIRGTMLAYMRLDK